MRREYLIDGYNLLRSRPEGQRKPGPGNLQKERLALLRWIGTRLEENAQATVVFDAASSRARHAPRADQEQFGVTVYFADQFDTADEMIQQICREHTHPKQLVVVSNDRQVQKSARRRKAKVMRCEAFMAHLAHNARLQQLPAPKPEKPQQPTPQEREHLTEAFHIDTPPSPPEDADPNDMSDFYRQMRSFDEEE